MLRHSRQAGQARPHVAQQQGAAMRCSSRTAALTGRLRLSAAGLLPGRAHQHHHQQQQQWRQRPSLQCRAAAKDASQSRPSTTGVLLQQQAGGAAAAQQDTSSSSDPGDAQPSSSSSSEDTGSLAQSAASPGSNETSALAAAAAAEEESPSSSGSQQKQQQQQQPLPWPSGAQPQPLQQQQQVSSSSAQPAAAIDTLDDDEAALANVQDMYDVISLASAGTVATAGSSSAGGDVAAAAAPAPAAVMSFEEEDLGSITDMYDVITRASVIASEVQQQQAVGLPLPASAAAGVAGDASSPGGSGSSSPAPLSRSSSSGSLASSMSGSDLAAIAELQTATERKLADLQHVVEELQLDDEDMTQQLTDVLHKLELLEQDLSAAVQQSISDAEDGSGSSSGSAAAAVLEAAPAGTVVLSGSLVIEHTVQLEALAASASMGGATAASETLDALAVPPPAAAPVPAAAAAAPAVLAASADPAKLWPLFVLGLAYVHQATSGFALPALLPMVSPDLGLSDFQGAMLTSGYSYLYALALVPVGLLADKVDRPKLLAVGLALWSSLSILSSGAGSFLQLLVVRTGFAVAQAAQNPVAFSLIPDLFPANKSTALAAYNCAIYLGRALSFASVLAAHRVRASAGAFAESPVGTMADAAAGGEGVSLSMVPLDKLDLQRMSIIYTAGDMAAVTPLYNYNFHVIAYESATGPGGWRELLRWIGYPGFAIALLMALTVREPRDANGSGSSGPAALTDPAAWQARATQLSTRVLNFATGRGWHHQADVASSSSSSSEPELQGAACILEPPPALAAAAGGAAGAAALILPGSAAAADADADDAASESSGPPAAAAAAASFLLPIKGLLAIKSFQATTIAAALNDLGSYALIAWHSTFYERVYGLDSGVYAPMLAVILPVGGILGGVGGGLIADYLSVVGGRYWLTAGASLLAAPFIAQSLLADTPGGSFSALIVGFALSEAWRAPGAIMIRSVAPQELGSTASALYLCIRNLVGGVGPVAVAKLAEVAGLQHAMLLAPACYVASGLIFLVAEKEIERQAAADKLEAAAAAAEQQAQLQGPGQAQQE